MLSYGERYLRDYGFQAVKDRIAHLENKVLKILNREEFGNLDNFYQEINNLKKAIGEFKE